MALIITGTKIIDTTAQAAGPAPLWPRAQKVLAEDKHVTTLARDIGEHLEDEQVIIKLERQLDRVYAALDGARVENSHKRVAQLEEEIDRLKRAQMEALDSPKPALLALDLDSVYQTTDQVLKRHDDDEALGGNDADAG